MYVKFFKPLIDRLMALLGLLLALPLLLVLSVLLMLGLKGNPFFVQPRVGINNQIFRLVKFRTMSSDTDENGELLPDEQRLSGIGKFIRSTSLDELPQLLNVLKGDMSLIGPRPLLVEYLDVYTSEELKRHSVLPGISGWAQIKGRNSISWKQKFAFDLWYVKNISFAVDVKIVLLSFYTILKRDGINSSDGRSVEKYNGNN